MDYDKQYSSDPNTFGKGVADPIVKEVTKYLIRNCTVLEIGAGQGRNAIELAKQGFNILATDISEVGVEQISRAAADLKLPNLKTGMLDMKNDIEGSFDLIISTFAIHYLAQESGANFIEKIKKHTNPNGFNALAVFTSNGDFYKLPGSSSYFYPNLGQLKEMYADWQIVYYNESEGRAHKTKPDGSPMFNTVARIVARRVS